MSDYHGNSIPTRKLDRAHDLANAFVNKKIDGILDILENDLLVDGVIVFDREKAKRSIGQQVALAYAMGALDRTENKFASRIITS